jgi:hypothetical protein
LAFVAVLSRVLLVVLLLLAGLTGCRRGPEQWGPFTGQVVDAETGNPLAGAHVMVMWVREPPSLHFSQWFYDAQETVTDAAGRFELRRETRLLTAFVEAPSVSIFVPGYQMQAADVIPASGHRYVDQTVVRMRPLKTREEQCKHEPLGVRGDAHAHVPRFIRAQYDYQAALQCGERR